LELMVKQEAKCQFLDAETVLMTDGGSDTMDPNRDNNAAPVSTEVACDAQ
jgi:hypothetical protein